MKSKKSTTFEEVDCLMKKLLVLDNPFLGPQNKSIAFKLSEHELEKKFSKQQGGYNGKTKGSCNMWTYCIWQNRIIC